MLKRHSCAKKRSACRPVTPFDPNYRRLRYVPLCRRLRDGLFRAKGRSRADKGVPGDIPARLAQAGAIQGKDSHHSRHQPGGGIPRLRTREPTGQRQARPQRAAESQWPNWSAVPAKVIEQHCRAYVRNGKQADRPVLTHDTDYSIVERYQAELRGVVQYYLLAQNVFHFGKLQWVMNQSLAKTLANKHKTTSAKIFWRYKSTVQTEHGEKSLPRGRGAAGQWETPIRGTVRWHTPEAEQAGRL